jgi:hypothetical protein
MNFQSQIAEGTLINCSLLKVIGMPWELSEDAYANIVNSIQRNLETNYRTMPEEPPLSNDPRTDAYANVVVGGKVVATIDNQGVTGVNDDRLAEKLLNTLPDSVNDTSGPDLAQARAEQIARLLGGKIVKSGTAITQGMFNSLPELKVAMPSVDFEAMKKDPLYAELEYIKQKRADYLAQHAHQGGSEFFASLRSGYATVHHP